MRIIFLDTETTGFSAANGDRIVELGAVETVNRRITGNNFHSYLHSGKSSDAGALAVHGLNDSFLKNKPRFIDIRQSFLDYINGAEVIIHNKKFDLAFLDMELSYAGDFHKFEHYCSNVIDSLEVARRKYPKKRNNLDALAKRLKISEMKRDIHGALSDSILLAEVYFLMTVEQGGMFSEDIDQGADESDHQVELYQGPVKVQMASEEDVEAHNKYLEMMKSKSEDVFWLK